ncbi:glycine cleavage system aminomethyltransferase GcvT [Haloechinothrix sp. LS1_15]|uniref:glycine cleavage system aminomethyltransferase GcvT n=1 Tax=Haloechinothrix sp. LS1_15 TaxID=2652248 RepID=UPI002947BA2E|nr:glycine cleavage system aminomethyltransferase GcvT [Haloechinothrix sp. LS1_15]MDV6011287.1 glycine cleavage system aminomethyltransferase GcvT [Haloechinothrix sp. LS1_15]
MATPSPLHEVHSELGASFTDFAGWTMPVRYSSELAEHHAVRQAAGLFDLSHMAEIEVRGPQAADMLDYAFVGNLANVKVGRARYSMLCNTAGGVLDDLVTYRLADDRYLVVANAANAEVVTTALTERAASFDVAVAGRSTEYALLAVQGPAAAEIVRAVSDADLDSLRYYASMDATVAGTDLLLARTGYTGEDGFELYCAPGEAPALWRALTDAGQQHGLLPAGLACRDTLRLEAGMPLYGNELSEYITPFDAGLGRLVKFDKPSDFVGRDALAARAEAEARQVLVGLTGTGKRAPRSGYAVVEPSGGASIGEVTSGALSPTLGYPIAMAYVPTEYSESGTELAVDIRGKSAPVEVVTLPFYRRS